MQPTNTPSQANTGDGTILPPAAAVSPTAAPGTPPTAASDQLQAQSLVNTPMAPPPSLLPTPASTSPAFSFNAPDMPTIGTIDPSSYTDMTKLSAAEQANQAALVSQQNALQQNVFGQYNNAIASQGSALDRYNALSQQMNLPVYQQQVQTIKGLLSRLSDNINTRAQGTFMNQAQRDQLEASEGKSLNNQLAPLAQAQTEGEANLAKIMGFQDQDNAAKLDPIKQYLASLDSAFSRQMSGLNANNSSASTALQSRLDAEEKARQDAQTAANQEWQKQMDEKKYQLDAAAARQNTKYQDIMAGIQRQAVNQAAHAPVAAGLPMSDAQLRSAATLNALGGPIDPNYSSSNTGMMNLGLNNKTSSAPSWLKNWLGF